MFRSDNSAGSYNSSFDVGFETPTYARDEFQRLRSEAAMAPRSPDLKVRQHNRWKE
jgi:hypothetical protein